MSSIFGYNAQAELCEGLQNVTELLEINNKKIIRDVICTQKKSVCLNSSSLPPIMILNTQRSVDA